MEQIKAYLLLALWSVLLASALAALALWKKALTRAGLCLAWLLALIISFCGGLTGFLALAATFVCTIAAGKLAGELGAEIGRRMHEKTGRRDAVQIVCNVLIGALMLLLKRLSGWDGFHWAFAGAMAASLADSMASELGARSKQPPRDVCTGKKVEAGLSGGVTPLGLLASALGAAVIAAICALGWGYGWRMFAGVLLAGFAAALLDSVLGSLVQAKYRCGVCGALTEKRLHCGTEGTLARGVRCIGNDAVNFINNCCGAAIAAALYLLARG